MGRDTIEAAVGGALTRALFRLPAPALRVLAGRPPATAPDLDPEAVLLARLASSVRASRAGETDPVRARERFVVETALVTAPARALPVDSEDRTVPGPAGPIAVRLYTPRGLPAPSPLVVFFHGGGWVVGSIATHDASCRMLAHDGALRVLSVDYRLAPEHPFPAAADDALAAYRWAAAHAAELGAAPDAIAVAGDSAGGNLAAVTARRARDAGGPLPAFQALIYPAVDFTARRPSRQRFGQGFVLTDERMDFFEERYVPEPAQKAHPDASPLLADDLAGLPPAYVAVASADPLLDEGEAYAHALRAAGVPTALHRHPHLHGFLSMTATRSGRRSVALVAGAIRQGLGAAGATGA
ncbi:MAG TPA: alpha/beta hydrolase [Capillimicrobium sp.]|jgi:acetyl esterase